jgi:hypothetical protein
MARISRARSRRLGCWAFVSMMPIYLTLTSQHADAPRPSIRTALDDRGTQNPHGSVLADAGISGWTIGRNVRIDTRWGARDAELIHRHAVELAALAPDVTLAHGIGTVAPRQATHTVPIVFMNDPVGVGSSTAWRNPAAMLQASLCTNLTSAGNGWSCGWLSASPRRCGGQTSRSAEMEHPASRWWEWNR